MKLRNDGEQFQVLYNGGELNVPTGEFEVNSTALGRFINKKAKHWGKSVTIVDAEKEKSITPSIKKKNTEQKETKTEKTEAKTGNTETKAQSSAKTSDKAKAEKK